MDIKKLIDELLPKDVGDILHKTGSLAARLGYDVYLVGGIVRDLLMGHQNLDIDIVVDGDGPGFAKEMAESLQGSIVVHDRFGTSVVMLPEKRRVDVATARTETYSRSGALPEVDFAPIEHDLERRDFSINALAVSLKPDTFGELLDFFKGSEDIAKKRIRVLHKGSFIDDPTRVFRAVRFEQRFGFRMTKETEIRLSEAVSAGCLRNVSGTRLKNEIMAIFGEKDTASTVERLEEFKVWNALTPGLEVRPADIDFFRRIVSAEDELESNLKPEYKRAYAYLIALTVNGGPDVARKVCEIIGVSRHRTKETNAAVRTLAEVEETISKNLPNSGVWKALEHRPEETLLCLYASGSTAARDVVKRFLEMRNVSPLLSGRDLLDMGYKPSPAYTEVLDRVFQAQLDREVKNAAEARAFAQKLLLEK